MHLLILLLLLLLLGSSHLGSELILLLLEIKICQRAVLMGASVYFVDTLVGGEWGEKDVGGG